MIRFTKNGNCYCTFILQYKEIISVICALLETPIREVLGFFENNLFLIIDHIHAKINLVSCAALALGKNV